jgi:putative PEP-CTERM system TPR-repeat lipoprotein
MCIDVYANRPRRRMLVAVALSFCVATGAAREPQMAASLVYEEALTSFLEGEFQEAKIHAKNVLLEDPALIPAHILLAKIYLEEGEGALAEQEIAIAERLGVSRTLSAVPLARALLLQRKYQELVDNVFPTRESAESDAQLLELRGEAHVALKRYDEAIASYEQSMQLLPGRFAAILGKATVLLRQGKAEAAQAQAIAALAAGQGDPNAWFLEASIDHVRGRMAAALSGYERVIEIDPHHLQAQIARAGLLLDLGRYAEAEGAILRLSDRDRNDPRLAYLLAVARAKQGDAEGARAALKQADDILATLPPKALEVHGPTIMVAALVRYSLGQWEQAYAHLEDYLRVEPGNVGARKLMGAVLLKKGDALKAVDILEPSLDLAPNDATLLTLLGEALSKSGRYVRASDLFDRALRIDPGNRQARARQAFNSLASGDENLGVERLAGVFQEDARDREVGVALYLAHMKRGEFVSAVRVAKRLADASPDNVLYLNLLASAQINAGVLDAARDSLERLLVRDPEFLPARINLGRLYLAAGEVQRAHEYLVGLQKQHPKNSRIMVELAGALRAADEPQEAVRWLERALAENRDDIDAAIQLTDLYLDLDEPEKAQRAVEIGQVAAPDDYRVLAAAGRVELARNNTAHARNIFRRMSSDAGYQTHLLIRIAEMQRQAADLKGAIWSLQKAVEGDPGSLRARSLLITLLVRDGKLNEAQQQAEEVERLHPESSQADLLLGDLALAGGSPQEALAHFQRASGRGAGVHAQLGLFRSLMTLGRPGQALDLLHSANRRFPRDLTLRAALAELALSQGRWETAQEQYEYIVQHSAQDATALNNLAGVYAQLGDPRALQVARRAVRAEPKSAAARDTLGWILVRARSYAEALTHLRNAAALAPTDSEIRYHLAVVLERLGKSAEARRELEQALQGGGNRSWREDALALSRRLAQ